MTHVVIAARNSLRTALEVALPGVSWVTKYWVKHDPKQLPLACVFAQSARSEKYHDDAIARYPELQVLLKRKGGATLEDQLWADAATIEAAAIPALDALSFDYDLTETTVIPDGDANETVGALLMKFSLLLLTPEGAPEV